MRKVGIFFGAMLYGTCWVVGLINLVAAVLAPQGGQSPLGYLPMILLPFGIILYAHYLSGWFPFRQGKHSQGR